MTTYTMTIKALFEALHNKENKRFFQHLVLVTLDDEDFSCALTDESVRYGTDDYKLFEQAVNTDFPPYVANQILSYEINLFDMDVHFVALDTAIPYYLDEEKTQRRVLFINAYPQSEYEETKAYKSGVC